jgi:hypothetical protein
MRLEHLASRSEFVNETEVWKQNARRFPGGRPRMAKVYIFADRGSIMFADG